MCQRIDAGWSIRQAAGAAGISERRCWEWHRRWREGDRELVDRSSRAVVVAGRTPVQVERVVCGLRDLRFSTTRLSQVLGMPERTVRVVLARYGLTRLPVLPAEPVARYEHPHPGGHDPH